MLTSATAFTAVAGLASGAALTMLVKALLHLALLRGLRAPREAHQGPGPRQVGLAEQAWQAVEIAGPQGQKLFAWWVPSASPGPGTPLTPPGAAVLVMHGWGANAEHMLPALPPLHRAGFAVLLLEARCHGRSSDAAFSSLPRFAEDIAAGLAWLRRQAGVDGQRLALLGHSVGAAAALLHAARVDDVCGVVSLAAFAHPRELMRRFLAERRVPYPMLGWWVLRHVQRVIGARFDDIAPITSLQALRCPVLLVHGRDDRTVPFADALRLQQASLQGQCADPSDAREPAVLRGASPQAEHGHRPAADRASSPSRATLLAVAGDHDLRAALASHASEVVAFLQACASRPAHTGMPAAADNAAPCSL